jgi:hypothetical protein
VNKITSSISAYKELEAVLLLALVTRPAAGSVTSLVTCRCSVLLLLAALSSRDSNLPHINQLLQLL